jgi:hypothetical protein
VTEASTIEILAQKLRVIIPELLILNQVLISKSYSGLQLSPIKT